MSLNHNTSADQVNNQAENKIKRDFIYTIPQSVLLDLELHLVDLRVYALVRSFMDTTGHAYFSNDWAAQKLGVDPLTVSRSISKHIKKGYLSRDEDDNGRRYLFLNLRTREKLVSHRGVDLQIKGGRSTDQGGVDLQINQLDQSVITSKNNNNKDVAVDKSLIEKAKKVGIQEIQITEMIKEHEVDKIQAQLVAMEKKNGIANPVGYLKSALKNDYAITKPPAISVMNPASWDVWSEDKYKQECKSREVLADPDDWRDKMIQEKIGSLVN